MQADDNLDKTKSRVYTVDVIKEYILFYSFKLDTDYTDFTD